MRLKSGFATFHEEIDMSAIKNAIADWAELQADLSGITNKAERWEYIDDLWLSVGRPDSEECREFYAWAELRYK